MIALYVIQLALAIGAGRLAMDGEYMLAILLAIGATAIGLAAGGL